MDIDNTIALKTQTPNMMQNIGGMLNVVQQGQQAKQGQMDLQERNALRGISQNLDQYKTDDGNLDLNKLVNDATQAAPKLGADWAKGIASSHAEQIAVEKSLNELSQQKRGIVGQVIASVATQPWDVQQKVLGSLAEQNPQLQYPVKVGLSHLQSAWESGGADAAKQTAQQMAKATLGVVEQNQLNQGNYEDVGGQKINKNPMSTGAKVLQNTLPPTTITTDANNNPVYTGGTGRGGSGSVPAGPPLGVKENVAGTVDTVNKHYQGVVDESNKAAQDIGVLQNIKKYAPGAVTGVAGDRRAYLSGLAGLLGMDPGQLAKTKTDLLAKESNMLALAGGDTNLAKTMAESANPNTHMTPEAITKAADRVISMRDMAIEKQHFFQDLKNDPQAYNSQLSEWNKHADPRVLQYQHMSQAEKVEMKNAMSPKEQAEFADHLRWFEQKGILK